MLNFVNFKNADTWVHQCILNIMLRILSNLLMAKSTETSAYLHANVNRTVQLFGSVKKMK